MTRPSSGLRELDDVDVILLVDIAHGRRVRETAERCHYSYQWVKQRRAELFRRLGASSPAQAVIIAIDEGLLTKEVVERGSIA